MTTTVSRKWWIFKKWRIFKKVEWIILNSWVILLEFRLFDFAIRFFRYLLRFRRRSSWRFCFLAFYFRWIRISQRWWSRLREGRWRNDFRIPTTTDFWTTTTDFRTRIQFSILLIFSCQISRSATLSLITSLRRRCRRTSLWCRRT